MDYNLTSKKNLTSKNHLTSEVAENVAAEVALAHYCEYVDSKELSPLDIIKAIKSLKTDGDNYDFFHELSDKYSIEIMGDEYQSSHVNFQCSVLKLFNETYSILKS